MELPSFPASFSPEYLAFIVTESNPRFYLTKIIAGVSSTDSDKIFLSTPEMIFSRSRKLILLVQTVLELSVASVNSNTRASHCI